MKFYNYNRGLSPINRQEDDYHGEYLYIGK